MLKNAFLYILALIVLLAPAIILGWIGWTLLDWWGMLIGIVLGLAIFIFSMNKIAAQEAAGEAEGVVNRETEAVPLNQPEEALKHD